MHGAHVLHGHRNPRILSCRTVEWHNVACHDPSAETRHHTSELRQQRHVRGRQRGRLPRSGAIAETWNGQTWKSWKDTSFCRRQPSACGVLDVSCASATTCVAVGFTTTLRGRALPRAAVWNGNDWHIADPPRPAKHAVTIPSAVSCTGAFCLTIGDAERPRAYVASYDANSGTWKNITSSARLPWPAATCGGACFLPGTLSCASNTSCMTSGLAGFFAWNGRQFRPAHPGVSRPRIKAQQGLLRHCILHGGRVPHRQPCPHTAVRAMERHNLEDPPASLTAASCRPRQSLLAHRWPAASSRTSSSSARKPAMASMSGTSSRQAVRPKCSRPR